MSTTRIDIGHDVRRYTTYIIENATDEELVALNQNDPEESVAALRRLYAAGRAQSGSSRDDLPLSPFDRQANAEVLTIDTDRKAAS